MPVRFRADSLDTRFNLDIVWNTVTQALPPLIAELEIIINSEEQK